MIFKNEYIKSIGFLFFYRQKKFNKEGVKLDKDKNRECTEKFLKFLYKIKERANKESKEKGHEANNYKLKVLINKTIGDIEILLEFYGEQYKKEKINQ